MSLGQENPSPGRGYDLWSAAADYPPWQGAPRRALVICTQHRSGSSLLGEAIHAAGGLGCPVEYFHGGVRPLFERRWQTSDFPSYVDALYRLRTAPSGVFGAKIVWFDVVDLVSELSPGEFEMLRQEGPLKPPPDLYRRVYAVLRAILPDPTWVRLTRRNTIEQAVSHFVAWETRTWRRIAEPDAKAPHRPAYDFDAICQILARIQSANVHWARFFRANHLAPVEIAYEDLAQNYAATLSRFFADIGHASPPARPPRLQKQADEHSQILLKQFLADFRRRAQG